MNGPVAYIVPRFPKLSETFVADEIDALERCGADVEVYALLRGRDGTQGGGPRRTVFVAGISRALLAQSYWLVRTPRQWLSIWGQALRHHARSPRRLAQALLGVGAAGAFALDMRRRGVSHVHAHFATHSALAAWAVGRLVGVPYSFTAHADDIFVRRPMLEEKVGEAAFVVTISDFNRRFLARQLGEEAARRIQVVHCGVDPRTYAPLEPAPEGAPFRILCVGRLEAKKGQRHLLEACRALVDRGIDLRCQLVGEGREQEELLRLRKALGLEDRVELLGACSRDEVRLRMEQAHVFALPCVVARDGRADGIPVALMEAMAMERPVVSTRTSGIPELVSDGRSGWLVEPGDSRALAHALAQVHADPQEALRRAREGARTVREHFCLEKNAARLRTLFAAHRASEGAGVVSGSSAPEELRARVEGVGGLGR